MDAPHPVLVVLQYQETTSGLRTKRPSDISKLEAFDFLIGIAKANQIIAVDLKRQFFFIPASLTMATLIR
ncbi:hypothetical protein KIN20_021501 [Parelaphostrongylus tenuis]|uniref:Uncharacterized protein n=1 Tax=Parelaphostrongylus tenuis TaxID=148309 RepID=A0AAD5NAX3_PARTN|nr:hypothetical protein KIN20_021501 [Parelaphostrongylus tenuis]